MIEDDIIDDKMREIRGEMPTPELGDEAVSLYFQKMLYDLGRSRNLGVRPSTGKILLDKFRLDSAAATPPESQSC